MRRLVFTPEERIVKFKFYEHDLFGEIPFRRKYIHHTDINGEPKPSICKSTWNKPCPICKKAQQMWEHDSNGARKYVRHPRELYCVEIVSDSKGEFEMGECIFIQFGRVELISKYINYVSHLDIDDWFDSGVVKIVCHKRKVGTLCFYENRYDSKFIFNDKEYPLEMPDDFMEPTLAETLKSLFREHCNKSGRMGIRKFVKIVNELIENNY